VESSNKKMSPALKVTIVFLILAVLLTFFSRTLYQMNMPTVHLTKLTSGNLNKVYRGEGVITPNVTHDLYASAMLEITKVYVQKGDDVKKGDLLIEFDVSDMENTLLDMRTEHEKLVALRPKTRGKENKRLLEMDIADSERHIKNLEEKIEKCRRIEAPVSGNIVQISAQTGMLAGQSSPLVSVSDPAKGFGVASIMPMDAATWFETGNTVKIIAGKISANGKISKMITEGDAVEVSVEISDERIRGGEIAKLEFTNTTQKYTQRIRRGKDRWSAWRGKYAAQNKGYG